MKIIVYPHSPEIGGSQLNAVELAGAARDRGHGVVVFCEPGPLRAVVDELGLPFVPSPPPGRRPSPAAARALCRLARDERADVVHGYEWPPALEAVAGPQLRLGVPAVATVMSMGVAPFIPRTMPLVVGTELLRDDTAWRRPGPVHLIEPPVDVEANGPGTDTSELRERLGLRDGDLHVVVVSRLAPELKLEGILTAASVVGELARSLPVRLVVVGDGPARDTVERAASAANEGLERPAVLLTGLLTDPRPAYALADVVLGMGGSALRAMAFARPLIVQGEGGFWCLLTPRTVDTFLWQGWYGVGPSATDGRQALLAALGPLLADPDRRAELGDYARKLVVERFSLTRAAAVQEEIYAAAAGLAGRRARTAAAASLAVSTGGLARYKIDRRWQRARGRAATDDFNARAAQAPVRPPTPEGQPR